MGKAGILVVSFGTSYRSTLAKNIEAIEKDIAAAFPGQEVRRAFTSGMIIRKLKRRDDLHVDTVDEAMEGFLRDGFTDLTVQPTHVINGHENDGMLETLYSYRDKFCSIRVGSPLLTDMEDYRALSERLLPQFSDLTDRDALVFMGHGTEHHANAVYPALDYMFKADGHPNVHVGTVEGYPDLEQVKSLVRHQDPSRVFLSPLMVVAGDHACNDMAGDEEDSWKNQFAKDGYPVSCILKGLGEYPAVREMFVEHARKAKPL